MTTRLQGFFAGAAGGLVGLFAMAAIRKTATRLAGPPQPRPTEVFLRERSMSLIGPQHRAGEPPIRAAARQILTRLTGSEPTSRAVRRFALVLHASLGVTLAGALGAVLPARIARDPVRTGGWFGAAIWLGLDELIAPLFGLADRPTAIPPRTHVEMLAADLVFGGAAATTAHLLGGDR